MFSDRLPSAMRPPLQKRGHSRSVSHGGTSIHASAFYPSVAAKSEKYPDISSGASLFDIVLECLYLKFVYKYVTKQMLCI